MMGDGYPDVPLLWRAHAVLGMIRMQEHAPNPDLDFLHWADEAGGGDEQHLRWAFRAWEEVRTWTAFECEEQRAIMGNLLRELDRSRDTH